MIRSLKQADGTRPKLDLAISYAFRSLIRNGIPNQQSKEVLTLVCLTHIHLSMCTEGLRSLRAADKDMQTAISQAGKIVGSLKRTAILSAFSFVLRGLADVAGL
jgi:hypothetical protein